MGKFETQIRPLTLLLQAPAASERSRLVDRSERVEYSVSGGPGQASQLSLLLQNIVAGAGRGSHQCLCPTWRPVRGIRTGRRHGSDTDVVDECVAAFPFLRISPRQRRKFLSFYTSLLVHASPLMPRCTAVRRFTGKRESCSFTCQIGVPCLLLLLLYLRQPC